MFPQAKQNILRFIFAISIWPGLVNLTGIIQFKLLTKIKGLTHNLLLAPNFIVFDRPGFFLQKKFYVEYTNGETEIIDFDSSLYSKIRPYPLSSYVSHSLNILENKSGSIIALEQIFCSRQIEFINLKYPVKQVTFEETNLISKPLKTSLVYECLQK